MIDGFYIGSFKIYFYGIIIMFGVLVAVLISYYRATRYSQDKELIWDMLPWLLVSGIIGARLWHVLTPSKSLGVGADYYFTHPIEIFNIRNGGLGIPGAVIGGAIGLWLFSNKKSVNFLIWADIISPGLAIAQAIGRWGNFINQELYGPPTNLPWGIYIDPSHRLPGYESFSYFHPMFLYESLWNLCNFILLICISRNKNQRKRSGELFFIYMIVYSFGRFMLEFIRLDASFIAGINANQLTMLVVGLFGIVMILIRRIKKQPPVV